MIRFTEDDRSRIFNPARQTAFLKLSETLAESEGKENVTELDFRDLWLEKMSSDEEISADGWYSPPPYGMAVLSGSRLNFDSLRNQSYWPVSKKIDFKDGLLYAYASPVDRVTGRMGDLSVTLYFGKDERIRSHFQKCHEATTEVFLALERTRTAGELFQLSQEIFSRFGLKSNVISRTDNMPINLGHTFECLPEDLRDGELSDEKRQLLSNSRRFLNSSAKWQFIPGMQFTVEPQLISAEDPDLPKVTQHYVVLAEKNGFTVCNDIDLILNRYTLI